jgi:chromosome segregation ATPase
LRNLLMFRELCGENPLKNVILVTTGWGRAAKAGILGQATQNERQLRTEPQFWANMIKRGSDIKKFQDTRESALEIIFGLVDRKPTILKIQKELVDENRNLVDTSAGHVVNEEIKRLEEKYRAELLELAQQMEEAKARQDKELQEVLADSKKELERLKEDARHAQDELNYERRNHQRQHDQDLEDMKREVRRHKEQVELQLKAQRIEDRLQFEGIVQQLRDNEYKVRQEERMVLEQKIAELEKSAEKNKRGSGKKLLVSLAGILGAVAMSFLGFPLA